MNDTFEPTAQSKAKLTPLREAVLGFATDLIDEFTEAGLTPRQAGSTVAHLLLDGAWASAAIGAISENRTPNPILFEEAAKRAHGRLDLSAFQMPFRAQETTK